MKDRLSEIRAVLEQFWADQSPVSTGGTGTVDDLVAAMDSVTVCEVLDTLEEMLGIDLPSGQLVRPGGYDSQTQFLEELGAAVDAYASENVA